MSIKSELTKTASYLRNARNAIIGRGGEISLTAGLKDLSDAIYAIPSDAALVYQTDESVAYRKIVPTGVLDFAQFSKVGGMTYKSKNFFDSTVLLQASGVTVKDGVYSGTIGTLFAMYKMTAASLIQAQSFELGKTYTFSFDGKSDTSESSLGMLFLYEDGTYSNPTYIRSTEKKRYSLTNDTSKKIAGVHIAWNTGTNFELSNLICREGTSAEYEPYFSGLRHTKTTKIVSEGANLIPFPFRGTMGAGYTTTNNGITFTVLDDGRVMANGTATANARFSIVRNFALPKGVFRISGGVTVDGVDSKAYVVVTAGLNGLWVAERTSIGAGKFDLTAYEYDSNDIYLLVVNGTTLNNAIFEPMVSVYQEATLPYKPYKGSPLDTLTIPASVQALDGYGVGINADCYNYVDFEKRQFVKRVGTVDLGTRAWGLVGNRFKNAISDAKFYDNKKSVALCEKYENYPFNVLYANSEIAGFSGVSIDKDGVCQIVDKSFSTAKEFKTAMSGVLLYYELVEPEVTDISTYLDDTIEVEGGGTLTAVNEYENDVPTTINYIAETAGV